MCGLTGFWQTDRTEAGAMAAISVCMAERIAHRGPDDSGAWVDAENGIALAHRRLSILDLSPAGLQPMLSASGRYVIVFNGEIYNHLALRQQLHADGDAPAWRGHSDTEILVACIEAWGLERALKASVGMFALALWDRSQRTLSLARDRLGEKPLYYGWQAGVLLFGSELKALTAHPAFEHRIDRDALALLLRHNYIPAPYSIWRGISKLPPGTLLTLNEGQRVVAPVAYWSFSEAAEAGQRNPIALNGTEVTDALERVLRQATAGQMLADVPLGALLSGGVDSSTIVALMQAQSMRPVKTFSIGFHEKAFDESVHAAAVARHLGTDHTELFMHAGDVLDAVPRLPLLYDEPFADSSQLPTALVMSLARQHVTVALSGDGGDEVFGGYNRYFAAPRVWNVLRFVPHPLRQQFARLLIGVSASQWDRLARPFAGLLNQAQIGDKAHKLGQGLLDVRNLDELYMALVTQWEQPENVVRGAVRRPTTISRREAWPRLAEAIHRMMAVDTLSYLPDDILVKVDRAAMAVSLETRAPFLDHRVVEFSWCLPSSMKCASRQGKIALRRVLYRYVPQNLIDRPKMGFGIPLDSWLRGRLRDWAAALLDEARLRREGYFEPTQIRRVWEAHQHGNRSFGYRLWSVLMFQAWLETTGQGQ
ncbi:asparagine synthase (glutamine-hydrolyzing) [Dokdonella soli]|uniref:asparagine synthase (glutamine-hydrolyzing) n=1 Tax=Dokdonella soli TaxID=529810 RepID=A0ABN1ID80_9GAMM